VADRNASPIPIEGLLAGTITVGTPTPPEISIGNTSVNETNAGTTNATFIVSLSAAAGIPVTVNFATANGTAMAGIDYASTGGTLTFLPGETEREIVVPVLGDTLDEPNETFFVNLSMPIGASIADGQGQGTIIDDDSGPVLHPWQNPDNPLDVDDDGSVSAIDVLLVIDRLNRDGPGLLPVPPVAPDVPPPYVDPSGDDALAPFDALLIINAINEMLGLRASRNVFDEVDPAYPTVEPVPFYDFVQGETAWSDVAWALALGQMGDRRAVTSPLA
jgi:hypothetical protein